MPMTLSLMMEQINMIDPTPKRLCTESLESCTYCKYDTPHPSPVPSDWSSEDWDGDNARNSEQKSLAEHCIRQGDTRWSTRKVRQALDK